MKNDSNLPQRKSIRLPGFNYTQPGAYFVTLCAQGREVLFGEIVNGEMRLNAAGRVVQAEWERLGRQFPHIRLGAFVVMPNHVHGIIQIVDIPANAASRVGATRHMPANSPAKVGATRNLLVTINDPEPGSPVPRHNPAITPIDDGGSPAQGAPGETQTNGPPRSPVDGPPRATLIDDNEITPGAIMGQMDSRPDVYGSPLRDASNVGATRREPINPTMDDGWSPVTVEPHAPGVGATRRGPINPTMDDGWSPVTVEPHASNVGAARREPINPSMDDGGSPVTVESHASVVGATRREPINPSMDEGGSPAPGAPVDGRPNGPAAGSLGAIIGQFKARATRRIRTIAGYEQTPVWQRNYYEHIIRNEAEWGMIFDYIEHNPARWEQDQLHPHAPENPFNRDKPHG